MCLIRAEGPYGICILHRKNVLMLSKLESYPHPYKLEILHEERVEMLPKFLFLRILRRFLLIQF